MEIRMDEGVVKHVEQLNWNGIVDRKGVRKLIRKEIVPARRQVQAVTKRNVPNDPRKAYKGVSMSVYKGAGGGEINILTNKRARSMALWRPKRGGKSGIVRKRKVSMKTKRMQSYTGKDRAFVLRFLNSGTTWREAVTVNNASRGMIAKRNFFAPAAKGAMDQAGKRISTALEKLIVR